MRPQPSSYTLRGFSGVGNWVIRLDIQIMRPQLNWIEYRTSNPPVAGSTPAGRIEHWLCLQLRWIERAFPKRQATGSNPVRHTSASAKATAGTPAKTVCVLDWEFAHAGIGILDFAILLRHRHQFPLDLDALKNGYKSLGGVLPDEWVRSALITDLVNIMHLLDSPTEQPQLFAQLMQAITTTMNS